MPPTLAIEHRRGTWMKMDDNGRFDHLPLKKMVAVLSYARKFLKVLTFMIQWMQQKTNSKERSR